MKAGTLLINKKTFTPEFKKLEDTPLSWWVSLTSTYLREWYVYEGEVLNKDTVQWIIQKRFYRLSKSLSSFDLKEVIGLRRGFKFVGKEYELRKENEKPLYDEKGNLNRFGFRWTDNQVFDYYSSIMLFRLQ